MLGRLISSKGLRLERNIHSEKGYRDAVLVTSHVSLPSDTSSHNITVPKVSGRKCCSSTSTPADVTEFLFPANICQSTLGGRIGSNACTVIALLCGYYFVEYGLPISPSSA